MVRQGPPGGTGARGTVVGDFAALCREFLAEEYEAAPVTASGLGLTQFDGRLDDLSEAAFEERRRRSAAWRARFHLVGCFELLVIRERHLARVAGTGTAALRDFHDRLAGSGGLPPALAERASPGSAEARRPVRRRGGRGMYTDRDGVTTAVRRPSASEDGR